MNPHSTYGVPVRTWRLTDRAQLPMQLPLDIGAMPQKIQQSPTVDFERMYPPNGP